MMYLPSWGILILPNFIWYICEHVYFISVMVVFIFLMADEMMLSLSTSLLKIINAPNLVQKDGLLHVLFARVFCRFVELFLTKLISCILSLQSPIPSSRKKGGLALDLWKGRWLVLASWKPTVKTFSHFFIMNSGTQTVLHWELEFRIHVVKPDNVWNVMMMTKKPMQHRVEAGQWIDECSYLRVDRSFCSLLV